MHTPEERKIFGPYWDGAAHVYGDPLCLYRRVAHALGGEPARVLQGIKDANEAVRYENTELLIRATREVFELMPFDKVTQEGVLDRQVQELFKQFCDWLDEQKKSGGMTPTSPASTPAAAACPLP